MQTDFSLTEKLKCRSLVLQTVAEGVSTLQSIAARSGLSVSCVRNHLNELQALGFVKASVPASRPPGAGSRGPKPVQWLVAI